MNATNTLSKTAVAVANGDGIGPEILSATLKVLEAAGSGLDLIPVSLGEGVYNKGISSGIEPDAWSKIRETKIVLKAPVTTPQGKGVKSLNVTLRKTLGLYANVRPCVAYSPFVPSHHPGMDVVIIRENEEDLYAGIEHRQTDEVYQCLKLVTRPGCERICRYAFEYARVNGRKKVTCMTKDNIMKLTDGLFHQVFDEMAREYPEIATEHYIIDIGMARMATHPTRFDVVVTLNLYGDIISDVAADVAGSVGLAPSANIGTSCAMFEAIHGSAPDIAGQNIANPIGLMLASVMMLQHIGQTSTAATIHNAILRTLEEGVATPDIFNSENSTKKVGTSEFAETVIKNLGLLPQMMPAVEAVKNAQMNLIPPSRPRRAVKETIGIDVFVSSQDSVENLATALTACNHEGLSLKMITNRGVQVWPKGFPETSLADHWRCRFQSEPQRPIKPNEVIGLLSRVYEMDLDVIKTETLCLFDGEPGFSLGQGQ